MGQHRIIPIFNHVILVSPEDYDFLIQFRWSLSKGYARRNLGGYRQQMHMDVVERMGLSVSYGFTPDHENGNPLDNRRENLRIVYKDLQHTNTTRTRALKSLFTPPGYTEVCLPF